MLTISGAIHNPTEFSLEELKSMKMVEKTLTVECIGNSANGGLLGTVRWKGINVFQLLDSLGIESEASFVKYHCADGYFTYNTIEELRNMNVLGALFMNGEPIPEKYGFPLRIIFPGYYGVRQPAWVEKIEILESGIKDFWSETQMEQWSTDFAMAVDSKIFFPEKNSKFILGDTIKIGGAAYGSRRISSVEIRVDGGESWIPASIVQSLDEDHVWIFWLVNYVPQSVGEKNIFTRATAYNGRVQPKNDFHYLDGTNSWPSVSISVEEEQ